MTESFDQQSDVLGATGQSIEGSRVLQAAAGATGAKTATAGAAADAGNAHILALRPVTVNAPPTVSLTAPTDGASYAGGAPITLTAAAADSDGTITQVEFFHGGTNLIATLTQSPYTFDWTNAPSGSHALTAKATDNGGAVTTSAPVNITVTAQPTLHFIHPDHLDTPRLITNQAQQVVWRWDNDDPFGGNMANENPSGLGVFAFNLRFPGQYFDKETNLHYNYFRDYSPEIGRYIESDPIGLASRSLSGFPYVGSNPLGWNDPLGLQAIAVPAGPAGAGGATWWQSQQRPRDASGFGDDLFPDAGQKPGATWPDWLKWPNWMSSESAEEQSSVPERGLPPAGIKPPIPEADQCKPGPASRPSEREKGGKSLWDPNGGEWRYFPGDKWHNPHWDYNPHSIPSSPWQNIPIGGLPPVKGQ
jgi:RHS repeat-associated protein